MNLFLWEKLALLTFLHLNFQIPTPIIELHPPVFAERGVRFFVKRDDLVHPEISGNKWRKLKYNLLKVKELRGEKLLTFGGAFSNHLAAVAAAGQVFGFQTTGIVRGERVGPLNPTLSFCEKNEMALHFVSRRDFREKTNEELAASLKIDLTKTYLIPDGGSNELALPGVAEVVGEIENQLGEMPDYICSACGTGATLAGIVTGQKGRGKALGISVLKGDFMAKEVIRFLGNMTDFKNLSDSMEVRTSYHHGGYAKFTPELIQFINQFKSDFGIPIDPIYTGKLAFALFDLAEKDYFKKGETVVMVHTGGLQGVAGFNQRFGNLLTLDT